MGIAKSFAYRRASDPCRARCCKGSECDDECLQECAEKWRPREDL